VLAFDVLSKMATVLNAAVRRGSSWAKACKRGHKIDAESFEREQFFGIVNLNAIHGM